MAALSTAKQLVVRALGQPVCVRGYQRGIHPRLYNVMIVWTDGSTTMTKSPVKPEGPIFMTEDMHNLHPFTPNAKPAAPPPKIKSRFLRTKLAVPGQK